MTVRNGNLLIKGDNLEALQFLLNEQKLCCAVDLIYIDPPYATGIDFMVSDSGRASTISSSKSGSLAYSDKLVGSEFIDYLRQRLLLMHKLLSDRGSIYLHIDYKIGHYVKVMMDEIFGINNFRNDISRIKCNPKNFERIGYGNVKDLVLFYTKTADAIWNEPKSKYSGEDEMKLFPKVDEFGRRYTTVPIHAPGETQSGTSNDKFKGLLPPPGRHWRTGVETLNQWDEEGLIEWSKNGNPRKKIFLDDQQGKRVQDIWEFKDPQYAIYPTEKNGDMLDLIIKTSSNQDSLVLDCFCGSGSTLEAAHRNDRSWIGIDSSEIAIRTTMERLSGIEADIFVPAPTYSFLDMSISNFSKAI